MSSPSGHTMSVCRPDGTLNVIGLRLVTDLEIKPVANRAGRRREG